MNENKTYISILRGINVSGKKIIKMDDLRSLYSELGFEDVVSYIQSGNVIFRAANQSPDILAAKIRKSIADKYSFDVPVIVMDNDELNSILEHNPLTNEFESDKLHITILDREPSPESITALNGTEFTTDRIICLSKAVYLYCPNGYGNTKFNNNFIEKKLKVSATTRNLSTLNELIRLAQNKEHTTIIPFAYLIN